MPKEARMILASYNDLLIKENIVENDKLKELCAKIWRNNREALDILIKNKPSNVQHISKTILEELCQKFEIDKKEVEKRQRAGHIFRFATEKTKQKNFEFYL